MRRRDFIAALGGLTAPGWSRFARAQAASAKTPAHSSNAPLVGFLNSASPVTYRFTADAFREGLAQAGFVEGRNVHGARQNANVD